MTAPLAPVVAVTQNPTYPGAYLVRVACPYCPPRRGKPTTHTHGAPSLAELQDGPGHRSAHCTDRTGRESGYVIPAYTGRTPR